MRKKMETTSLSLGRKKPVRKVRGGGCPPWSSLDLLGGRWCSTKVVGHSRKQKREDEEKTSTTKNNRDETINQDDLNMRIIQVKS